MHDKHHRRLLLLVLFTACAPFAAASLDPEAYSPATAALFRRAECPANTFQCATSLGAIFNDICCQNGQLCALDSNNNPACCPTGAVCTGTAPATTPGSHPTATTSYVPNAYYSFPYAPTIFPNSASCASAVGACSQNYDACVTGLRGSNPYPVTIVVPGGGGTTVEATTTGLGTQATSICASLSSQACSNLQATQCASFGNTSGAAASYSLAPSLAGLVAGAGFVIMLISQGP